MNQGIPTGPPLPANPDKPWDGGPAGVRRFELTANCSLTPASARIFVLVVASTTFAVAAWFTAHGFWPVLPFAGAEIALLIWAVRASMRAGRRRELITITEESVTVERYSDAGLDRSVFPRHWVRVKLHAPPAALHPSRLTFESHGHACEVGTFLTEDERRSLAARLKQVVGNANQRPASG